MGHKSVHSAPNARILQTCVNMKMTIDWRQSGIFLLPAMVKALAMALGALSKDLWPILAYRQQRVAIF